MLPNVYVLTATCGRHTCLERSVRCFIEQDYEGEHTMLIHNNSDISQVLHLPNLPKNKHIKLINLDRELVSGKKYTSLGQIYNDTITFIPPECEVISFWDDDDIFLPNHISEGVKGYIKSQTTSSERYTGYKPAKSYYRGPDTIALVSNTLEPSMFVSSQHIKNYGFSDTTSDQHHQWLSKANIFIDPEGTPTMIYNWGDHNIPTWKTSGDPGNPNNFKNYRVFSQDHGDKIVIPITREHIQKYYDLIKIKENA